MQTHACVCAAMTGWQQADHPALCRAPSLCGSGSTHSRAEWAKQEKWKTLFLSEKRRAASLLAHERQLEQEKARLAQHQSKGKWCRRKGVGGHCSHVPCSPCGASAAPVGRSVTNPPSHLVSAQRAVYGAE